MTEKSPPRKRGPARKATESKACQRCGAAFSRPKHDSVPKWNKRIFCSRACSLHSAAPPTECPLVNPNEILALSRAAAKKVSGNPADREDIAQECCVYVVNQLRNYRGGFGDIKIYLARVIFREARQVAKRRRIKAAYYPNRDEDACLGISGIEDGSSPDPACIAEFNDLVAEAERIRGKWKNPKSQSFHAIHVLEERPREASKRLGLTRKKVESLAKRGLAELRSKMSRGTA